MRHPSLAAGGHDRTPETKTRREIPASRTKGSSNHATRNHPLAHHPPRTVINIPQPRRKRHLSPLLHPQLCFTSDLWIDAPCPLSETDFLSCWLLANISAAAFRLCGCGDRCETNELDLERERDRELSLLLDFVFGGLSFSFPLDFPFTGVDDLDLREGGCDDGGASVA